MTKEPITRDVDFRQLTEHILNSYLNANSEEGMEVLKLLDESMSVIGTGKQEFFRNLQEFSQAFESDLEQRRKVKFKWTDFRLEEQKIDEDHTLVYGSVLILGAFPDGDLYIRMDSRFTILYGFVDGIWKVLHIHHSVPDKEQMQNEEFPWTLGQQIREMAREKEEELEEMHEILAASRMATWSIVLLDGQAPRMEADDLMLELLGVAGKKLTPEEVYDAWFSNITPASLQSVLNSVEKMKKEGRDENTYLWKHPVLGERYVRCGGTAKPVEGGFVLRGYHYDVDEVVREQKQKDEVLAHALEAAQQANKAKTTFLNSMSHDIRTPMNAIVGFTALARTHIGDRAQVQDYLGKISAASAHLLSLINDILDMSRIESGMLELQESEVHIPDLLHDLRTMVQNLVNEKNQNLHIDMQDIAHENVFTDKLRLNQVLLNIVGNAIKFTQAGGDITIQVIEKPFSEKGYTTVEFSVKDNGVGMSKEFLGHIFETFTREYSATVSGIQGTGLGMAITKNIVDMMGGDIRVESEKGKGSVFTVTLNMRIVDEFAAKQTRVPALRTAFTQSVTREDAENPEGEKENRKAYDYSGKRVLLVEDNELNREIATAILEDAGMAVDCAEDGDIAVSVINNAPGDQYDLIFMDIQMPKMDGYTATREIRTLPDNRKANIPIVAMTANAFDEDKRKCYESGMNGHIIKPIGIEAIAKVLDEIFLKK